MLIVRVYLRTRPAQVFEVLGSAIGLHTVCVVGGVDSVAQAVALMKVINPLLYDTYNGNSATLFVLTNFVLL